jgi:hypothetical protein
VTYENAFPKDPNDEAPKKILCYPGRLLHLRRESHSGIKLIEWRANHGN